MPEKKELKPGDEIAKGRTRLPDGSVVDYKLYFGNTAMVGNIKTEFPQKSYIEKLNKFLASDTGIQYKQPTQEEIEEAYRETHGLKQKPPEKHSHEQPEQQVEQSKSFSNEYVPISSQQQKQEEDDYEEKPTLLEKLAQKQKENKQKNAKKKLQKQEKQIVKTTSDEDEDIEEEEYEYSDSHPIALLVLSIGMTIFIMLSLFFGLIAFDVIDNPFGKQESTVTIAVTTKDLKAGDKITADDLEKETITEEEYLSVKGGTIINSDGTSDYDRPLLWSNKESAINAYVTDTISSGDKLMLSDFGTAKADESWVTLSMNGNEVKVPASVVKEGETEIKNYLIITSKATDGTTSSFAVDNGSYTLKDKNIIDIKDSNGSSILKDVTTESNN